MFALSGVGTLRSRRCHPFPLNEAFVVVLLPLTPRKAKYSNGPRKAECRVMSAEESQKTLSVVLLMGGDVLAAEQEAARLLAAQEQLAGSGHLWLEWILVVDGPQWGKILAPTAWVSRGVNRRRVVVPQTSHHFGVLANHGLLAAGGQFVAFLWPGCELESRLEIWQQLLHVARKEQVDLVGGRRPAGESRKSCFDTWLPAETEATFGYASGWLEMQALVPLSNTLLRRSLFDRVGGFSPSVLLQRFAGWEFSLRAARTTTLREVRLPAPPCRWGWHDYPWQSLCALPADLAARALVSAAFPVRAPEDALAPTCDGLDSLLLDLDCATGERLRRTVLRGIRSGGEQAPAARQRIERRRGLRESCVNLTWPKEPLRITVLGGLSEPAHNYFCFYCFFERLVGTGRINWRVVYDRAAHPADLLHSDLVILSRMRGEQGPKAVDFCNAHRIPTLYLLNDNWFWLYKDRPEEYAAVLAPGKPAFENFLYCCRQATAVMTQNALIAADVRPHAQHVVRVDPSIDLSIFAAPPRSPDAPLRIGYVGTPRWEVAPFRALVAVAKRHPSIEVYVMSQRMPEALRDLPARRLIYQPYVFDYKLFARIVAAAHPDVLIAPLEDNRSQASKCPNKYFDFAGAGAAGVYSNLPPYTQFIEDGRNGLLVDNDEQSWVAALERLVSDPSLRRQIVEASREDIRRRYTVDRVLPAFLGAILDVIQRGQHPELNGEKKTAGVTALVEATLR